MIFYCHLWFLSEKFRIFVEKVLAGSSKSAFYLSFWTLRAEDFCWKTFPFLPFPTLSNSFTALVRTYFTVMSKGCFTCPEESFEEKLFHWKEFFSLSVSDILCKVVSLLARFFWAGLSKVHSTCLLKPCKQKYTFLEKNDNFFIVFGCRTKFLALCQNFLGRVVETAYYLSIGKFWAETFFFKKMMLSDQFRNSSRILLASRRSFLDRVVKTQNCILRVFRNIFRQKFLFGKLLFLWFSDTEQKIFGVLAKISQ